MNWNDYFMKIAHTVAEKSKDPTTKVGCVFVSQETHQILSTGYNGFPRNVADHIVRQAPLYCRPNKHLLTVHAEANAICAATMNGVSLKDSLVYITHPPCHNCMMLLIQVGVRAIYHMKDCASHNTTPIENDWRDLVPISISLATEAGIPVYSGTVDEKYPDVISWENQDSMMLKRLPIIKENCLLQVVNKEPFESTVLHLKNLTFNSRRHQSEELVEVLEENYGLTSNKRQSEQHPAESTKTYSLDFESTHEEGNPYLQFFADYDIENSMLHDVVIVAVFSEQSRIELARYTSITLVSADNRNQTDYPEGMKEFIWYYTKSQGIVIPFCMDAKKFNCYTIEIPMTELLERIKQLPVNQGE